MNYKKTYIGFFIAIFSINIVNSSDKKNNCSINIENCNTKKQYSLNINLTSLNLLLTDIHMKNGVTSFSIKPLIKDSSGSKENHFSTYINWIQNAKELSNALLKKNKIIKEKNEKAIRYCVIIDSSFQKTIPQNKRDPRLIPCFEKNFLSFLEGKTISGFKLNMSKENSEYTFGESLQKILRNLENVSIITEGSIKQKCQQEIEKFSEFTSIEKCFFSEIIMNELKLDNTVSVNNNDQSAIFKPEDFISTISNNSEILVFNWATKNYCIEKFSLPLSQKYTELLTLFDPQYNDSYGNKNFIYRQMM